MLELFRALATHQARFHQSFLESWGQQPEPDLVGKALEALVYDGLWLTKFPLLWTPAYGIAELDAANKAWTMSLSPDPEQAANAVRLLRPRVDADVLRMVLSLPPAALQERIAIFFGGRAMNKPLWQYWAAWFEHSAALRGRLGGPGLLDTAFL